MSDFDSQTNFPNSSYWEESNEISNLASNGLESCRDILSKVQKNFLFSAEQEDIISNSHFKTQNSLWKCKQKTLAVLWSNLNFEVLISQILLELETIETNYKSLKNETQIKFLDYENKLAIANQTISNLKVDKEVEKQKSN